MTTTIDQARAAAEQPNVSHEQLPELKFENPGTEVYGQVLRTQFGFETKFGEGNLIDVKDHVYGDVTVWLSNVQLRAGLVEGRNQLQRPVQAGDIVYVRYDSMQPLDGGKTLKNFSIHIQAGTAQVAVAALQAQPVAPAPVAQPAVVPAPVAQQPVPQAPVQPVPQAPVQPAADPDNPF